MWVVVVSCLLVRVAATQTLLDKDVTRISYGSCSRFAPNIAQPVWSTVQHRSSAVWVWMGDNVYADKLAIGRQGIYLKQATPERLEKFYQGQIGQHEYASFLKHMAQSRKPNAPPNVIGTWDDHDYGKNDGDSTYEFKIQSQKLLLDFLNEPTDSPRRKQHGVYATYEFDFGEPGSNENRRVRVILLDCRYNRDPYVIQRFPSGIFFTESQSRKPIEERDFLGEEQWRWLSDVLHSSTSRINLIVSSIQVLPLHRQRLGEGWAHFPNARSRLHDLIFASNVSSPIILSGDVHFSEHSMALCREPGGSSYSRLLEITSSGITHSWGHLEFPQFHRWLAFLGFLGYHYFVPQMFRIRQPLPAFTQPLSPDDRPSAYGDLYTGLGFGELEIDWKRNSVTSRFITPTNVTQLSLELLLSDLDPKHSSSTSECSALYGEPPQLNYFVGTTLFCALVLSLLAAAVWFLVNVARLMFRRFFSVLNRHPKQD